MMAGGGTANKASRHPRYPADHAETRDRPARPGAARRRAAARRRRGRRRAGDATGGHQRRARAGLPRDRRHPRGQGRDRVQDRRLSPGRGRDRPGAVRRRRRRTRRASGGRSRASARRSPTRSSSSRRPATWRTTRSCGRRSRPPSSTCCGSRASGRRPCGSCGRALGIADLPGLKQAAQEQRAARRSRASRRAPSSGSSRASRSSRPRPRRLLIHRAQAARDDLVAQLRGVARRHAGSSRRARSAAGASRSATWTCSSRRTDAEGGRRPVHRTSGVVDKVLGAGPGEGGRHAPARPAGRPDGHAAGRGRDVPRPLHRLGGPQHPAPRASPATAAGACPRRASSGSTRRASRSTGDAADLRTFPDEAAAYAFLDLAWIEPELREDRGEIEAAREGRLPTLITRADLRGDLHSHSDWSDGVHSIEVMAEACPPPRLRVPGAHRPLAEPRHRARADAGPRRAGARDHRRAQRPVRRRGGARRAPRGRQPRRLPAPPRLRARGPGRRQPRLRGRPPRPLRPRRRVGPRRPPPAARRAHPAHAQRDPHRPTSTSSPTRRAG